MKKDINAWPIAFALVALIVYFIWDEIDMTKQWREDRYEAGFNAGYAAAELDMDYILQDEYNRGYENGSEESYEDPANYEDEAAHYARQFSDYHPIEAREILDEYYGRKTPDPEHPVTEYDYLMAIESLYRFYEYFLFAMYQ